MSYAEADMTLSKMIVFTLIVHEKLQEELRRLQTRQINVNSNIIIFVFFVQ